MRYRQSLFRFGALVLAAVVALGVNAPSAAQNRGATYDTEPATAVSEESLATIKDGSLPASPSAAEVVAKAATVGGNSKLVSVVVKLDVDSLAAYAGGVPGLAATSPRATGAAKLDTSSPESVRYRDYVAGQITSFEGTAAKSLSHAVITNRLDIVIGGVTMVLPSDEVALLMRLPGVQAVYPDTIQKLDTERSVSFIGAPSAWNQLGGQSSAGEGVIVGVLDSGIWPEHPSVSDPDPSGKPYAAPPPAPDGERACEFSGGANPGASFSCNNKLIGADRFMATYEAVVGLVPGEFTTARDDDGHGSHTATTAAGNAGVKARIYGQVLGSVSGVAPRAHLMVYKVCGVDGCFSSDSAAAIQEAIEDGVNVINFSISGGANPYSDAVSLAFLDAYDAGIFVAASAGNSGPGADTTDHREPWVTTVAASTSDRAFLNTVTLTGASGSLTIKGTSLTAGISTPTEVVVPAADPQCLAPFAAGSLAGKIVVCARGVNGRVEKGYNVFQGGAAGMILYNQSTAVTDQETDNHYLPTIHIQFTEGEQVLAFLAANPGAKATLTAGTAGAAPGDVMASFSSRGGPGQSLGISKPDITAPGVQVLAGHTPAHVGVAGGPQGELFQAIAGTSMSSPHIAGSGALIKAIHPDWTPGQIKSALMTSARTEALFKEDGVTPFTPFDAGSGRVDLRRAWRPGVTFEETAANFVALRNELWKANLPSLYVPVMPGIVTVSRTAKDVTGSANTYRPRIVYPWNQAFDFKVTVPATLNVPANGTASFDITVDARNVPIGQVRHAEVVLFGQGGTVVRIPISIVRKQPVIQSSTTCAPATIALGQVTDCSITMTNTSFSPAAVSMTDQLPRQLRLVNGSVTGGTASGNGVAFTGTLTGRTAPTVTVGLASANLYLSLASLGAPPNVSMSDETIVNFTLSKPFIYAGESYTSVGMVSNGYAVVGGGTGADIDFVNRAFPNTARPNNVLAPFWTDLDGSKGGQYFAYTLCDGSCADPAVNRWFVMEWLNAPNFSSAAQQNSFQIWLGQNGVEDITFSYGPSLTGGDAGFLTVGAENFVGSSGANFYSRDGITPTVGTAPTAGQNDVVVTGTPGTPAVPVTVTFKARGHTDAPYDNYALLTSPAFFGTSVARFSGVVTSDDVRPRP